MSGIVTAWCITQLVLGLLFAYAYFVLRRERDLFLFGMMCLALAYLSASSARALVATTLVERESAVTSVLAAALLAAAFNLHFVLTYVNAPFRTLATTVAYVLTAALEVVNALGLWWQAGTATVAPVRALGFDWSQWRATASPLGTAGFVLIALEIGAATVFLFGSWRRGKSEAVYALIGALALVTGALTDILLSVGLIDDMIYLVPHSFMIYAFAGTAMLVSRQRRTVEELANAEGKLKRAAEELRVSHEELQVVQDELSIKQQLAVVGELAAAIAHEVRNPLAVITNAVAGLRRAKSGDDEREVLLGIVEEEAQRLNQLVTDLLRFARPTKLKRTELDVPELVASLRGSLPEGYELVLETGSDAPTQIEGDANLLRAALQNVVQNACQAMPSGGTISCRLARDAIDGATAIRLELEDQGTGMSEATLSRALDPFFTTRPSGTGLGLPIVQRVLAAHGGQLRLSSRPGEGTTVSVKLPLVPLRASSSSSLPPARASDSPTGPIA